MEFFSEWGTGSAGDRICSVTTGLVKNNWDDKHPGMIQAEYFLGTQGKNVTGWMPVASMKLLRVRRIQCDSGRDGS